MTHFAITQDRLPSHRRLQAGLQGLRPKAPIVIMLHGFKYDPALPARNPHRHIFSVNPDKGAKRVASWPRRLGLRGPKGMAIGFGWHACGTIWQAHRQASTAAEALTILVRRIHHHAPDHPIHIVAHSLGARVALQSLSVLPQDSLNRVILIAAAAFEHELTDALNSPAGRNAEVINIRSRANTLFDLMLRAALPHWGVTVGRGRITHPSLLDIDLDCNKTQSGLSSAGFSIARARCTICHWSGYLRQDVCALYRGLLHRPERTPLPYLRSVIAPSVQASGAHGIDGHLSF